jgi:type IV secretory pathway protease TraF
VVSGYVIPQTFSPPRFLRSEEDAIELRNDEYFVLADNSPSSLDSRFWGPLHRSAFVGRVTKIYWPLDRAGIAVSE